MFRERSLKGAKKRKIIVVVVDAKSKRETCGAYLKIQTVCHVEQEEKTLSLSFACLILLERIRTNHERGEKNRRHLLICTCRGFLRRCFCSFLHLIYKFGFDSWSVFTFKILFFDDLYDRYRLLRQRKKLFQTIPIQKICRDM